MPTLENPQHELFVQHYVRTRDPEGSKYAAGFSESYPHSRILAIPTVAARIQEILAPEIAVAGITAQRVMRELGRVAFQSVKGLYDENGDLIPPHLLDDDTAATISGIDVEVRRRVGRPSGDDEDDSREEVVTKKIRRVDKMAALGILARHFKIVGEDNEGVNALANALADRLKSGRQRAFQPAAPSQDVEDARIIEPTPAVPVAAPPETPDDELWQ